MRTLDWNDLRHLLAVARAGSYLGAAKALGVDDATVSRRLARLEATLGATLLERGGDGRLRPTDAGARALTHADAMEAEAGALEAVASGADAEVSGVVRITSTPILINRLIAPAAPAFLAAHPKLSIELAADAANLSLTGRDADLALRMARPTIGGSRTLAQRVGSLAYDVFEAAEARGGDLPWLGYDAALAHLPHAAWIASECARSPKAGAAPMAATDAETLIELVAAGAGRTLLPVLIGERDPRLRRRTPKTGRPAVDRELWLLSLAERRGILRLQKTAAWLRSLVAATE